MGLVAFIAGVAVGSRRRSPRPSCDQVGDEVADLVAKVIDASVLSHPLIQGAIDRDLWRGLLDRFGVLTLVLGVVGGMAGFVVGAVVTYPLVTSGYGWLVLVGTGLTFLIGMVAYEGTKRLSVWLCVRRINAGFQSQGWPVASLLSELTVASVRRTTEVTLYPRFPAGSAR